MVMKTTDLLNDLYANIDKHGIISDLDDYDNLRLFLIIHDDVGVYHTYGTNKKCIRNDVNLLLNNGFLFADWGMRRHGDTPPEIGFSRFWVIKLKLHIGEIVDRSCDAVEKYFTGIMHGRGIGQYVSSELKGISILEVDIPNNTVKCNEYIR